MNASVELLVLTRFADVEFVVESDEAEELVALSLFINAYVYYLMFYHFLPAG